VWIVFQNIGVFLQDKDMEFKLEAFCRFMTKREVDSSGMAETNTCWDLLPKNKRLARQTRGLVGDKSLELDIQPNGT